MVGWAIPPPKTPTKMPQEFLQERLNKVAELEARGFLTSTRLKAAMLKVPREAFIPPLYRDYAYLEVGAGSGYGTALAWEVVGPAGLVVTMELDPETYAFARDNLKNLGYDRVAVVLGDGSLGYPPRAPHDRICFTAAAPAVPPPLLAQLASGGRLIGRWAGPMRFKTWCLMIRQDTGTFHRVVVETVAYIPLRGYL